jgi:hypothetical protein
MTSSPSHSNSSENIIRLKPPISPTSSPNRNEKPTTTDNESCSKVLFSNDSSTTTTKRSPTRAGIMSRFAKSPHRIKRNNALLNALPIDLTPTPTETVSTIQPDLNNSDHILARQFPISSIDVSNSMTIPPRSKNSLDQNSF